MKDVFASLLSITLAATGCAAASGAPPSAPAPVDAQGVSPALEKYREGALRELWARPGLSPRDRSLATIAVMIARNQTAEMAFQFDLALQHGVRPAELSEVITHLAFYAGWGNAMSAVVMAKEVFSRHGVGADQLPPAAGELLAIDEAAEAQRAARVEQDVGPTAPGLVRATSEVLFHDLWLRPALAPGDRSLVTVSALVASGHFAQVTYHLNRAIDNGMTKEQVGELLTHLAFYAGWPNAMSTVPVARDVLEKRFPRSGP